MSSLVTRRGIDLPTLVAIAALCGVVSTQIHEGLGHGGACIALGERANAWGAYYFDCALERSSLAHVRIVAMAGSTMNLLLAIVAALLFRATPPDRSTARFGWWLLATLNAFVWAGYFLFSGVSGLGDWGVEQGGVLTGVANPWPWRVVLAVGGFAIYWKCAALAMRALGTMTGNDAVGRPQAKLLATSSYATIGVIAILVGLLNPQGVVILLASAAASSLGGASGLLWGQNMLRPGTTARSFMLPRNVALIVTAIVVVAAETVVLGPTVTF